MHCNILKRLALCMGFDGAGQLGWVWLKPSWLEELCRAIFNGALAFGFLLCCARFSFQKIGSWYDMTNVDSCLLMSDFVRLRLDFSSFQHVARFDSQNLVSGGLQTFCSLPTRGCRIYCRKQLGMILPSCKIQHGENGCLIEEKDFQEREREREKKIHGQYHKLYTN